MNDVTKLAQLHMESVPSNQDTLELVYLINKRQQLMDMKAALEENLSTIKKDLKAVEEVDIPSCMDELGVQEIKLSDGRKVGYRPYYSGSVLHDSAYDWLIDNGHGGIVKGELKIPFRTEQLQDVAALMPMLSERGFEANSKYGVHYQTMKGFVRECTEEAIELPADKFKTFIGRQAYVK